MKIKFIANIKGIYLGYAFEPGTEITIGREFGNTIAPINIDGFSRHHAKIYFKDGAWFVTDCGSTNGTYRNKAKLEAPAKIEKGDEVRCGTMALTSFEFEEAGAAPRVPDLPPVTAAEPPPVEAPAPAPAESVKMEPVKMEPVEMEPVEMEPVASAPAADPAKPATPTVMKTIAIKRPVLPGAGGGLKPGLKLPPKPGVAGGLKPGLKLPPKPGMAGGLKPGLKLPPKPLAK